MSRFLLLIILCLIAIIPISAQSLSEAEVSATMNRGFELYKTKQYSDALDAFLIVSANVDASKSEVERQVHVCSQMMACACYYFEKRYYEGYKLAKSLIAGKLSEDEKTETYKYYCKNGYMLALSYIKQDEQGYAEYKKSRDLLLEIEPYATGNLKDVIMQMVPLIWSVEGGRHYEFEEFEEALVCYGNAKECYNRIGNVAKEIYSLKEMANLYSHMDKVDEAKLCYKQAFSLLDVVNDNKEKMFVADALHRLSGVVGNMEQKLYYSNLMDSLYKVTDDKNAHLAYYIHKGKDMHSLKRFKLAEQWLIKAMDVAKEQTKNVDKTDLYLVYYHLGDLYSDIERYEEAIYYLQKSLGNNKSVSLENYITYIMLANSYLKKKDFSNCLRCLDGLFKLEQNIKEPRALSKLYFIRGCYYNFINDYQSALTDYKKADDILASKYPKTDGDRTLLYALLGGVEHKLEHYNNSEYYYNLYTNAVKYIHGEYSLNNVMSKIYLANAQGFAGQIKKGCNNYTLAVAILKEIIKKRIPYMNTLERESFWSPLSSLLTLMTPYALKAGLCQTKYTRISYNALLVSKAFLLDSERSLYDIVLREGDETDMQTYMSIAAMNDQLEEWEKNYSLYADSILKVSNRIAKLENVLMKRCESIGDITSFMDVDYDTVKQVIKGNDVLVDFTDFVLETGDRRYAAYIVKKRQQYPLLKSLFGESQLDSLGITRPDLYYDEDFASEIIKLLWDPIREHIPEGATVYYVPSQILFQICLESLPLEDGTLLGDHYNFVRLSSARELVKRQNINKSSTASAVLYGGLEYDLEPEQMAENAKQYDLSSLKLMQEDIERGDSVFKELPGSKLEIEKISEILKRLNFDVTSYIGKNGSEESFLNMHGKSPRILHMATHGFYYTPKEAAEVEYLRGYANAMALSGLIMSGANTVWNGKELPEGVLGGVLTASNIARLDLSNTDMVVLSACRTGQGDATAEGLYGLQRAFKKAGVGTMVMTLWNVSDKVTTEFMIKFYEALAENGWDKHKAFQCAKSQIRDQYRNTPYYWAAFVMLD